MILDIAFIILILAVAILGYKVGFITTFIKMTSMIGGLILAILLTTPVTDLVCDRGLDDPISNNIYENITKKYDYIITNPPIRVGKEILYKILFGAKEHLKPNGELYFVINKAQGAKSVARDLEKIFLVTILDKNKGFYIIKCQNK